MMFTCSMMEGDTVVFAPLDANPGFTLYNNSALFIGKMSAST